MQERSMIIELLGKQVQFEQQDDELWLAEVAVESLGNVFSVEILSESTTIESRHIRMLDQTLLALSKNASSLTNQIYEYFGSRKLAIGAYGNLWGDDFSGVVDAESCWLSLEDLGLYFDLQWEEEPRVVFSANCDWQADGSFRFELDNEGNAIFPGDE